MDQYTNAGFWHPKGEHHNLQDVQPLVAIWQHHLITHAIRHSPFGLPCLWDGRFYLSFGAWQREIAGTKYPGHLMRQETWNMTFGLWVWWSGENIIWSTMDCTYFGKLCFGSFNLFWLACLFAFVHIFWVYGCSVPIRFLGCMVFAWLKIQNMVTSSQGEMDILNAVPFFKTHYIVFLICIYIYVVHFPNRGTTLAKFTTKDHWFGHALRSCNRKSMHTTGRCFFLMWSVPWMWFMNTWQNVYKIASPNKCILHTMMFD